MRPSLFRVLLSTGVAMAGALLAMRPLWKRPHAAPDVPVAAASAAIAPAPDDRPPGTRDLVGVVLAEETIELTPRMQAKVRHIAVRIGDPVKRGDVIVELDCRQLRQQQSAARADVAASAADRARAVEDLDYDTSRRRKREAGAVEIRPGLAAVSPAEVAAAVHDERLALRHVSSMTATVAERRARLQEIGEQLADCEMHAPFDGTVAVRYLDEGALAGPGIPVVRLIRGTSSRVRFAAPETDTPTPAIGDRFRVVGPTGAAAAAGVVERVAPEIEPSSRTIIAEGRLDAASDAPSPLRAGTVVRVQMLQRTADASRANGPPAARTGSGS